MNQLLKISEVSKKDGISSPTLINNQIEITNTSGHYLNNLKLCITKKEPFIVEQCIIRERGALSFDPALHFLEIGNLAPLETAYFEYKFTPLDNLSTLLSHITVSYTLENTTRETHKNIADLLQDDANT